jgi:hypothetical protein
LTKESDGLLVELLRVADVGGYHFLEWEVFAFAFGKLGSVFLCPYGNFAADGVFGGFHMRIDVVYV